MVYNAGIKVRVKIKRNAGGWTSAERAEILQAVNWGVSEIGIQDEDVRLNVVLNADPSIYGDAYYEDDLGTATIRISSKEKSNNRHLRTVFHELWHVFQYLRQGLELGEKAMFNGKEHDFDYWNAPWEKAARHKESYLLRKYQKHLDRSAK